MAEAEAPPRFLRNRASSRKEPLRQALERSKFVKPGRIDLEPELFLDLGDEAHDGERVQAELVERHIRPDRLHRKVKPPCHAKGQVLLESLLIHVHDQSLL